MPEQNTRDPSTWVHRKDDARLIQLLQEFSILRDSWMPSIEKDLSTGVKFWKWLVVVFAIFGAGISVGLARTYFTSQEEFRKATEEQKATQKQLDRLQYDVHSMQRDINLLLQRGLEAPLRKR